MRDTGNEREGLKREREGKGERERRKERERDRIRRWGGEGEWEHQDFLSLHMNSRCFVLLALYGF